MLEEYSKKDIQNISIYLHDCTEIRLIPCVILQRECEAQIPLEQRCSAAPLKPDCCLLRLLLLPCLCFSNVPYHAQVTRGSRIKIWLDSSFSTVLHMCFTSSELSKTLPKLASNWWDFFVVFYFCSLIMRGALWMTNFREHLLSTCKHFLLIILSVCHFLE